MDNDRQTGHGLRGIAINVLGGSVVNSLKTINPDLFPINRTTFDSTVLFSDDAQIAYLSDDNITTDYASISAGNAGMLEGVQILDIYIKSINPQTVIAYTAGAMR